MRVRPSALALAALALSVTACGAIAEEATERLAEEAIEQGAGGGDVDIDIDDEGGNFSVESSEGSFQVGTGSELPEAFPDNLPLPGDYEVVSSFSQSGESSSGFQVTMTTTDDFESLRSAIESGLDDGGWEIENTSEFTQGDDRNVSFAITDGEVSGGVVLIESSGEVTVSYTLGN